MPTRIVTKIINPHNGPRALYWTKTGNVVELTEPSDSQLKEGRRQYDVALDQRLAKRRRQAGFKTV